MGFECGSCGEFIEGLNSDNECPECGQEYLFEPGDEEFSPECPHCGMEMKKKGDDWICPPSGNGCEGTITHERAMKQKEGGRQVSSSEDTEDVVRDKEEVEEEESEDDSESSQEGLDSTPLWSGENA